MEVNSISIFVYRIINLVEINNSLEVGPKSILVVWYIGIDDTWKWIPSYFLFFDLRSEFQVNFGCLIYRDW